ncbi:hypothetical protein [Phenylobacterium kunshanense]|uniref:hypothetical protein n=1 Tax=Phenylobacterium kunshanense TaxID=1445034 RepID=UPI00197C009F|nr:hypothetical protein [Phenylobacterium kunshanense]
MPRPVLQLVATGIVVASLGAFALGVATAPSRGRLPGERPGAQTGEVLEAVEAQPLVDERIQGAAVQEELTEEEKAALEAEKKAKAEAAALAKAEAEKGAPAGPEAVTAAPADKIGEVIQQQTAAPPPPAPKVEEPVF